MNLADELQEVLDEKNDKITRLRAEVERLRAALEMWMDAAKVHVMMDGPMFVSMMHRPAKLAWENARAALSTPPAVEEGEDEIHVYGGAHLRRPWP